MTMRVLAVDVGGTKIAAAVVDGEGSILWSQTAPTTDADGASRLTEIAATALSESRVDVAAIGLAIPAVLDLSDDSVVWSPNIPSWDGLDIRSTLHSVLPVPVAVEYDGHAAALGEGWVGAGAACDDFVVVAVGTGIGCGIVANGET